MFLHKCVFFRNWFLPREREWCLLWRKMGRKLCHCWRGSGRTVTSVWVFSAVDKSKKKHGGKTFSDCPVFCSGLIPSDVVVVLVALAPPSFPMSPQLQEWGAHVWCCNSSALQRSCGGMQGCRWAEPKERINAPSHSRQCTKIPKDRKRPNSTPNFVCAYVCVCALWKSWPWMSTERVNISLCWFNRANNASSVHLTNMWSIDVNNKAFTVHKNDFMKDRDFSTVISARVAFCGLGLMLKR